MLNPFLPARPQPRQQPHPEPALSPREAAIRRFYESGLAGLMPYEARRTVLDQITNSLPN